MYKILITGLSEDREEQFVDWADEHLNVDVEDWLSEAEGELYIISDGYADADLITEFFPEAAVSIWGCEWKKIAAF